MTSAIVTSWGAAFRSSAFRLGLLALAGVTLFGVVGVRSAPTPPPDIALSPDPLYSKGLDARPTMTLALSVEFPTVGAQYMPGTSGATVDTSYAPANEYFGYFDAESCYSYNNDASNSQLRYFVRTGPATSRRCGGLGFSGNFMNWATSSAIDVLRLALTGGDRVVDTSSLTVLQRAVLPNTNVASSFWNGRNFPVKQITAAVARDAIPSSMVSGNGDIFVSNCLNRVHFGTSTASRSPHCMTPSAPYALGASLAPNDKFFYSRVAVCDSTPAGVLTDPRADYCRRYPSGNYKPIGNLQKHADKLRVAAFGYLNDNAGNPNQRYGGVLRAPMKYVGDKAYDNNYVPIASGNPEPEWDSATGVFLQNPTGQTTVSSGDDSNWPRAPMSGVTNYLNQFGRTGILGQYKTYDPVGELYYEALRYLQGLPPTPAAFSGMTATMQEGFPVYTSWVDPHPRIDGLRDYECVKNHIVAIGDVNTHNDKSYPGNSSRMVNETGGVRTANDSLNEPNFYEWTRVLGGFEANRSVSYTDGEGVARTTSNFNGANSARWGMETQDIGADDAAYFMAGAAYWANTHDIRGTQWVETDKQRPKMRVTTYVLDVNEFGGSTSAGSRRNNQFFLAAKYGGFTDTSKTGSPFRDVAGANSNASWESAPGSGEAKTYFLASSARKVKEALDEIFNSISSGSNTIAGVAATSQSISQGETSVIYQASFDPKNFWSGNVVPYMAASPASGAISLSTADAAPYTAASELDRRAVARNIVVGSSGVTPSRTASNFIWSELDTAAQNALRLPSASASAPYDPEATGQARLEFLRGDRTEEGGQFRVRGSRLGDIINSGVTLVGKPPATISGKAYSDFLSSVRARPTTLYVGANDGMLHAFNTNSNLSELFAYIPSWVVPNLSELTSKAYVHRSYVDATPVAAEAYFEKAGEWRTVLIGGTGGGGQGVYALDVTNPTTFSPANVLWEFTDRHDASLGNVTGKPQVLRFRTSDAGAAPTYKMYAVVASGVNNYAADGRPSATGYPALFLLDLEKAPGAAWAQGTNYFKIELPRADPAKPQGLINFAAVNGSAGEVDYIFAGDLQGNLWKLDFTTLGSGSWQDIDKMSFFTNTTSKAIPMFVATDGNGTAITNTQPITMAPMVVYGANKSFIVSFGTGKFLESTDLSTSQRQSFYALYDDNNHSTPADTAGAGIAGRGRLLVKTASGGAVTSSGSFIWGRPSSDSDMSKRAGWVINMVDSGERQISSFQLVGMKLVAGTLTPGSSGCAGGGGNFYVLDLFGGNGTYEKSDVSIPGDLLALEMTDTLKKTETDTSGARRERVTTRIVTQGSGGFSTSLDPIETETQVGRLSWRMLNNNVK